MSKCCEDPGDCIGCGQMTVDDVLAEIAKEQASKKVYDADGNEGSLDEVLS